MVNSSYIQGEDILDHHPDIQFDNGYSFSWGIRMVGLVGAVFGLVIMFFGGFALVLGPIFIIAGGFAATSWVGTEICYEECSIRDFHSVFKYRTGEWISTDYFTDVCILKLGKKQSGEDALGTEVNKVDMSKCEVYLMTYDHRKRVLVKSCDDMIESVKIAELICNKLDKNLVKFNPKRITPSENRRR